MQEYPINEVQEYTVNEEGFWEVPEGEGDARKKFSYRVYKKFAFPQQVSKDLRDALHGFGPSWQLEDVPPYVLAAFGLYRENYAEETEFDAAVSKFILDNFCDGFAREDGYCDYHKDGITEFSESRFNAPFFCRILASILAHHGVDEIYTIEASRLCDEPELDNDDTFGGEVWAIAANRIVVASTDELKSQLAEHLRKAQSASTSPRLVAMGMGM